ncbi:hypothetical protein FHT40_003945 [Mycolicibacterium sp. BK556]|nr:MULTISPECIES: hypothetical protein [Mycobacteriaceae]MBB3604267.1 hypothetical protein [Mycolicibacterium sp. BK556]MBB3635020.1 hypothetical protein [Mycolicibacterium sp. BK607]MBB3752885.1 hypothetical protein [Mycolicibacterium sp. BK634]
MAVGETNVVLATRVQATGELFTESAAHFATTEARSADRLGALGAAVRL